MKHTKPPLRILTIGHSTRPIEEFTELLKAHGVERVVDVRTIPRSRRNPQFSAESLKKSLKKTRIGYALMPGLGGLRHNTRASVNTGWRNASFRGFADYMLTPQFEEALKDLIEEAQKKSVAIMCAEAVPWRCHRSLIADALLVRGINVEHIMSSKTRNPHKLTPFAKVEREHLTSPAVELRSAGLQTRSKPHVRETAR